MMAIVDPEMMKTPETNINTNRDPIGLTLTSFSTCISSGRLRIFSTFDFTEELPFFFQYPYYTVIF